MVKKRKGKFIAALIAAILLIVTIFWIINIIIGQKGTGDNIHDPDASDRYLREFLLDQGEIDEYFEIMMYYSPYGWRIDIYEVDINMPGYIDISFSSDRIREPHWFWWSDEDQDEPDWYSYDEHRTMYYLKDSHGNNVSYGDLENDYGFFDFDLFEAQYTIKVDKASDYRFVVFTKAPNYDIELTYRSGLYYPSLIYLSCFLPVIIMLSVLIGITFLIVKGVKMKRNRIKDE